jgi:signal transduction histidine kinase
MVLVLLSVLPAFGLALRSAYTQRKAAAVDTQKDALRLVRLAVERQTELIETSRQLLITLSNTPVIRSGEADKCDRFVAAILKEYPVYSNIGVAASNGEVFCSAVPMPARINLSDRAYFKSVITGKTFARSEYQIGRMTGQPVLVSAYPVVENASVTAVVFVGLDLRWLSDVFARADAPDRSNLTAIDGSGTIIARYPNGRKWIGRSVAESWLGKTIKAQREGVAEGTGLDGSEQLFAFSTAPDGKLAVWASIFKEVAFAEVNRAFVQNLWAAGAVALVVLLAAWLAGHWSILRPVNDLVRTTEHLRAGELSARAQLISGNGELGRLAASFNAMAESLERRYLEIQTLRDIDESMLSTLNLRCGLEMLLDRIATHLPYSAATVRVYDQQKKLLEPVAWRNIDIGRLQAGQTDSTALPHLVFAREAPLSITDIELEATTDDRLLLVQQGYRSYLGIPLSAKDRLIGVLSFYTTKRHQFSSEETAFLMTIAGRASMAINNALLYEHTKQQAIDLEKANKGKNEFLNIISHELRTPLNVISGYTEILKNRVYGEVNVEQENALAKITAQSTELLSIVDNVLQATKIQADAVKVFTHEFDLGDVLQDLRSRYDGRTGQELQIRWDVPSTLPVVKTDKEKLKGILQNLLSNAIKFTEKGHVSVSVRRLPGCPIIEFKITDSGMGIPEETIPFIFEMFQQVDSSATRRHGGLGLGLYISKHFAELLGGKIEVQTEIERGSAFILSLPIAVEARPSQIGRTAA